MPPAPFLRRSLWPFVVALVVLIGQPFATLLVMQANAHHAERDTVLAPFWFILFLPSTVFDSVVRAFTGQSPVQVFGAFTADVYLGFGLNAVVWAFVAGLACLLIQKRLTRRWSERPPVA